MRGFQFMLLFSMLMTLSITGGCSDDEATVAPRTEAEIEEYKKAVYGAEEEMDEADTESE
ncbi:hypothetical protein CGZ80_06630 [Rhodopirellula sp. MGV]|nr:hypothetical protein CGZ80_06630 [Rhodopirellula sp. MGV]PNY36214.1 hypothetical protein C2E31_13950 [Rhodopirellula baltica]